MNINILKVAALVLAVTTPLASAQQTAPAKTTQATAVAVGNKAPDFELLNYKGKKVKLSDYQGKNVVLVFSRAHW